MSEGDLPESTSWNDSLANMPEEAVPSTYLNHIQNLPQAQPFELSFTIVRAVNLATAPLTGATWLGEQLRGYIGHELGKRFEHVPEEDIEEPDPSVAGPAAEGMQHNLHREEIRELYLNLLAASMSKSSALTAHPSYAYIIRQISPDEAKILEHTSGDEMEGYPIAELRLKRNQSYSYKPLVQDYSLLPRQAGCNHPELTVNYINNLERLRIIRIRRDSRLTEEGVYDELETLLREGVAKNFGHASEEVDLKKGHTHLTLFGKVFVDTCTGNPTEE